VKAKNRLKVNAKAGSPPEIVLYGDIGDTMFSDGITATEISKALTIHRNAPEIHVRVNSAGGDVFEGLAIANRFAAMKSKIVGFVDGYAASIATVILMGMDKVFAFDSSLLMIHKPWAGQAGNADDLRELAVRLDQVETAMTAMYSKKMTLTPEALERHLRDETWYSGPEALSVGLVDELVEGERIAASLDRQWFTNPPQTVLQPGRAAVKARVERMRLHLSRGNV